MANASEDARVDLPRDGAGASSRTVATSFWRAGITLPTTTTLHAVHARLFFGGDYVAVELGNFNAETTLRTTLDGLDALIGELLAAREQFRSEFEAKQMMAEMLAGLRCPVPDDLEDVPF